MIRLSENPDANAEGLLASPLDPLRYASQIADPAEASGIVRKLMPEHVRVLDIGCGTGGLTLVVNEGKDNRVLAIEASPERAAVAAEHGVDVIVGVADKRTLARLGRFDVVVLMDVLEHVSSPADLLDTAIEALVSGGRVIASVPNVAHWTVRARLLLGRWDYQPVGIMDATHLRWFTRATLTKLFKSRGLQVTAVEPAAGAWMAEYRSLLGLVPGGLRRDLIAAAARIAPTLFASQFVVEGVKP
jgi:methionine biosynthesis protein MetW